MAKKSFFKSFISSVAKSAEREKKSKKAHV